MDELQCDDFYIPTFLVFLPSKGDSNGGSEKEEDFLKNIEAWTEGYPAEDHDE